VHSEEEYNFITSGNASGIWGGSAFGAVGIWVGATFTAGCTGCCACPNANGVGEDWARVWNRVHGVHHERGGKYKVGQRRTEWGLIADDCSY
jgi:hypothetical protein